MSYISKEDYIKLYGDITDAEFEFLSFKAVRIMEEQTTGVDGFNKLEQAAPVDEDALKSLKYCAAELIHALQQISTIEKAGSLVSRTDGTMAPAMVSSVSSGTESISYSTNGISTALAAACGDFKARTELFFGTVHYYLSGVEDANGVNLLYMGVYPYVW